MTIDLTYSSLIAADIQRLRTKRQAKSDRHVQNECLWPQSDSLLFVEPRQFSLFLSSHCSLESFSTDSWVISTMCLGFRFYFTSRLHLYKEIFRDLPDTVENVGKSDFDAPLSGDNLQRFEDPQLSGQLLICVQFKKKVT